MPEKRYNTPYHIDDQGRECTACRKYLSWDNFYPSKQAHYKHSSRCKACILDRIAGARERKTFNCKQAAKAQVQERPCSKCGVQKPFVEFWRSRKNPLGISPTCRDCSQKTPTRPARASMSEDEKREKRRQKWQKWRAEKISAGLCVYCGKAPPKEGCSRCDGCRKRRRELLQRRLQRSNNYCKACGAVCNNVFCGDCWGRSRSKFTRNKLFEMYGSNCVCCGETNKKLLTADHINNDGRQDRWGGLGRFLRTKRDDIQIMCMNCNWGRAQNGGICPHQEGA